MQEAEHNSAHAPSSNTTSQPSQSSVDRDSDIQMGIPVVYRYNPFELSSFNRINRQASKMAMQWIQNTHGAWSLFITGANGVGKSSYAVAIIQKIKARYPMARIRFITPGSLEKVLRGLADSKDHTSPAIFKQWCEELNPIVLDDVGGLRPTAHLTEKLTALLMSRHDNMKKIIITTNLSVAQFARHVDPRIASRLQKGMMIDMGTVDLRRESHE